MVLTEEKKEKIKNIISDISGVSIKKINDSFNFYLYENCLSPYKVLIEIINAIEMEFFLEETFSEEDSKNIKTVKDLFDCMEKKECAIAH